MHRFALGTAMGAIIAGTTAGGALAQSATADPALLQRLEQLEERIRQLENRNKQLEEAQAKVVAAIPIDRAGDLIQPAVVVKSGLIPVIGDPEGRFTFKPRGVIDFDFGAYRERAGGFDYLGGTNVRRARIGLEGTAFGEFAWRIEADFAESGKTELTDAYLAYVQKKDVTITVGQFKVPQGFEGNSSDNYNTFLESSMFVNSFGSGAGRRIGIGIDVKKPSWTFGFAFSGDNNSASRADEATDGSIGLNGRLTFMPVNSKTHYVQVGGSSYWRTKNRTNEQSNAFRVGDRPNVRIDNTRIADSGTIDSVGEVFYAGGEIIASSGPFSLQGEYGHLWVERSLFFAPKIVDAIPRQVPNLRFQGFYAMGSWLLTGERRPLKGGTLDRIRPARNFDLEKGDFGAFELAFRYDEIDLTDSPGRRAGNEAHSYTTALNWYLTSNIKMMVNWVRFAGVNTPLDPVGDRTKGDAFAGRFHIDF